MPILWMISSTLRAPMDSFKLPPAILPTTFELENYRVVFQKVAFEKFVFNSLKIALLSTALQLLSSSMAAFAFARLRFRGRNVLFFAFLASMMIPAHVMGIPRFILMSKLRLIDNHLALILPAAFGAMGIFLIRQFMLTIPKSYDEAAYIDGAGKFFCYARIILPMAKPALMVIALQTLIGTWNDFYGPLIYINSEAKMTLPLGLTVLRGVFMSGNQGVVLAGVVLSLLAPLVFYLIGQRFLMEGITLSGLKG
ncbi:MAG TPA: carbohydrate ABC transporter permease [Clostridia bacterium]|nr:carbohydrate ABC transporter permease [Clostridia bacterium]